MHPSLRVGLWTSTLACMFSPLAAHAKITFGNPLISAEIEHSKQHLHLSSVNDLRSHASLHPGEAFVIVFEGGKILRSSEMLASKPKGSDLAPNPSMSRASAHVAGSQLCSDLKDAQSQMTVHWCLVERGDAPYLRQEVTIHSPSHPLAIQEVDLFRFVDPQARVDGKVAGSLVVDCTFYLGFEHPLSHVAVQDGQVVAGLDRTLPLQANQSITYSSVIGTVRPGQLRRDFLSYIEQERAHPYRTFLHYNTWFDLGFGNRFDAAGVVDRMHSFGEELVRKRGVTMDSFLLDDGWDNTRSLWGFDSGFPHGFTPLKDASHQYGFGFGVWLSPWGGYSKEKQERIAYGKSQNYEIVDNGYALSGPKYYAKFEEACLNFITKYGVNQFKFDGTGNAGQVFPGSIFDSDFSAAIHLIEQLRQKKNDIFINLTTGTKPSPFWLRYADSIWRSGHDHDFDGEGSWRQKWITYRDEQTYRNIVQLGPLFPLNSLMLHGIIYAQHAKHLGDDPEHDFKDEVHTYFGGGTQLQEMYITPSLLTSYDWDTLAEAARWSRGNAETLRDTHWIGGDPGHGDIYGWASWHANHAILVLRNPTPHPQEFTLDAASAFELPEDAQKTYRMRSPWKTEASLPEVTLEGKQSHTFSLKAFQVITLESN